MKFSGSVTSLVMPEPFATGKTKLTDALAKIYPEDDTAVYDATLQGVELIKRTADADHINAVVVLTDGEDTHSRYPYQQVLDRLGEEAKVESGAVRVFTIAYGSEAQRDKLDAFAKASGGKGFAADTADIEQVYRSISSFF